jgi:hypothetical protein
MQISDKSGLGLAEMCVTIPAHRMQTFDRHEALDG